MTKIIAMVLIETEDPKLTAPFDVPTDRIREAVVAELHRLSQVVAIMPEDEGKMMVAAHMMACEAAGMSGPDLATSILRSHPVRRRRMH